MRKGGFLELGMGEGLWGVCACAVYTNRYTLRLGSCSVEGSFSALRLFKLGFGDLCYVICGCWELETG